MCDMNVKLCLFLGTGMSFISCMVYAQCVDTQDCETLGYTENSCNGAKGIKCPFGNKWACLPSEEDFEQEFCDKYKFIQTCDGEKQNATGVACNGKYNYCECEQGYVWKNNICQKDVPDGANGDLYYCNGQVVAVRVGMDFYVALRNTGSANISAQDAISAGANYTFCNNIKGHLPTKTELQTLYRYFSQVNQLLAANGGQEITKERYWSSTEDPNNPNFRIYTLYYTVNMADGSLYSDRDDVAREYRVRPVLPL